MKPFCIIADNFVAVLIIDRSGFDRLRELLSPPCHLLDQNSSFWESLGIYI